MLNKILSNLHFNPDYLSLLKEYQVKQAREKFIRGTGFAFIILAFIVQVMAFGPLTPQTDASSSFNDLITGGVTSKEQIVKDCDDDYHYVAIIYNYYGVSCADIASSSSKVISLVSTDTSYGGKLWSVGHLPYGLPGETPENILGATVYWRYLHGWDAPGGSSTYTALKVTSQNGKTFFILFTCGNLVSVGFPVPYSTPPPPPPVKKPPACQFNSSIPATSPNCKPCPNAQDSTDIVSCLVYSKAAANLTERIANANNTTAKPGDVIRYTLTVTNKGKTADKSFVIQENLSDVLDYANLTDRNGSKLSSMDVLSWPAITIPSGKSVSEQFTVTVKNPLPEVALNPDDNEGYNNVMTNVYGNTINIAVKPNTIVTVANVVTSATSALPNTGPGASIFVVFAITAVVGYFYSRSRLLNKEALLAESIKSREV